MGFDLDILELAKQLRKPEGENGMIVGKELIKHNQKKIDWLLSLLPLKDEQQILEIGFGPGETVFSIASKYPHSTIDGVEISDTMIEMASERNKEFIDSGTVRFFSSDASKMPFEDKKFDIIYLCNVVHFWEDLVLYFTEIKRCLKDDGILGFYNPDPATWIEGVKESGLFIEYDEHQLSNALKKAGFGSIDIHHFVSEDKRGLGVIARK